MNQRNGDRMRTDGEGTEGNGCVHAGTGPNAPGPVDDRPSALLNLAVPHIEGACRVPPVLQLARRCRPG
eukprot:3432390-Alexandrium_andersonii.AAC.1